MNPDDFVTTREYEARNTILNARLDKIENKLDSIFTAQNNMRADGWKYVASSAISFFLGTGTYILSQFIINHLPH